MSLRHVAAIAIAAMLAGCGGGHKPEADAGPAAAARPARNVEVAVVTRGRLEEGVRLTGHLEALKKAEINSRLTGQVADVFVREGERVTAGEPLVRLVDTDIAARVDQARAALEAARAKVAQAQAGHGLTGTQVDLEVRRVAQGVTQAEAARARSEAELADAKINLDRQRGLFEQGAVPQVNVEQAQLRYDVARRNLEAARSLERQSRESLELARANTGQTQVTGADVAAAEANVATAAAALAAAQSDLADTILRSPIDGIVVQRNIQPGQTTSAMASQPLLVVVDNSALELQAPLDEKLARYVPKGTRVQVQTSVQDRTLVGRVVEVVPAADPSTHTVRVRIRVDDPARSLMAGAFATVTLAARTHEGMLVPRDAVQRREGKAFVFTLEGDTATRREVEVAYEAPERAVVTRGLSAGQKVITAGGVGLEDGQKVALAPEGGASEGGASPAPAPAQEGH